MHITDEELNKGKALFRFPKLDDTKKREIAGEVYSVIKKNRLSPIQAEEVLGLAKVLVVNTLLKP